MSFIKNLHLISAKGLNLRKASELNVKLRQAKQNGSKEEINMRYYFKASARLSSSEPSPLYLALKNDLHYVIDFLLFCGEDFGATHFTGKFAGFTALHHACLQGDLNMVKTLLSTYRVNPKVQACNGVSPVQLAAFLGRFDIVEVILNFGVSVNTEVSYKLFRKYAVENQKWSSSFGKKITLFTYSIFNNNDNSSNSHAAMLLLYKPNLSIQDSNNKTLLMHAIDNKQWNVVHLMLQKLDVQELNQCDDTGLTAVHTILIMMIDEKNEKYEDGSHVNQDLFFWLRELHRHGANVNVMINGDFTSLPIHIAAYHGFYTLLLFLLRTQKLFFCTLARPLLCFTQGWNDGAHSGQWIHGSPMETLQEIIEDYYVKNLIKYPVYQEEIKLVLQWMENDHTINDFVKKLDVKYNNVKCSLEGIQALFGGQEMSLYQVLMASQREYFKVAKSKNPVIDVKDPSLYGLFVDLAKKRLKDTVERVSVLQNWLQILDKMVKNLLLPYDCILFIVDFLNNDDLRSLIKAYDPSNN